MKRIILIDGRAVVTENRPYHQMLIRVHRDLDERERKGLVIDVLTPECVIYTTNERTVELRPSHATLTDIGKLYDMFLVYAKADRATSRHTGGGICTPQVAEMVDAILDGQSAQS